MMEMKEHIRTLLEEALPLVDVDSDFLFSELDSLGVTTILMILSKEYDITLEIEDATPKNLKSLEDRKSTRLNSSHANISYAVFCLKKKRTLSPLSLS